MAKQYRHRIGVHAEIYFNVVLEVPNPTPEQLRDAAVQTLNKAVDEEDGFDLKTMPEGRVLPVWNSVDREIEPTEALDADAVTSYECTEIQNLQ